MTIELTNDEKITILNSHLKNIAYNQYNVQLNLIEENAKSKSDPIIISNYNDQVSDFSKQILVLQSEIDLLTKPTA